MDDQRLRRDETAPPLVRLRDALRREHKADAARAMADHIGGFGTKNPHIEAIRCAIGDPPKPPTTKGGYAVHTIKELTAAQYDKTTEALDCLEFEWRHRDALGRMDVARPMVVDSSNNEMAWDRVSHESACGDFFEVSPRPRLGNAYVMIDARRLDAADDAGAGEAPDSALALLEGALDSAIEYTPTADERETAYMQTVIAEMRRTGKAVSEERMAELRAALDVADPVVSEEPPRAEWVVATHGQSYRPPGVRFFIGREDGSSRIVMLENGTNNERQHVVVYGDRSKAREVAEALYGAWWRALDHTERHRLQSGEPDDFVGIMRADVPHTPYAED